MSYEVIAQVTYVLRFPYFIALVIVVMLLAGGLGGLVNYYLGRLDNPDKANLKESIVIGMAASFLVPLFLQMISSNLLTNGNNEPLNLFILAGFCLIAAISSRAFISSLSAEVIRKAKEATQKAEQATNVAEQAKDTALTAQGAAVSAQRKIEVVEGRSAPPSEQAALREGTSPSKQLDSLIKQYNEVRSTQKPGGARTSVMTGIVREMIDLAPSLRDFPTLDYLRDPNDAGKRLAAYAYLYSQPDGKLLPPLVDSVTMKDNPPFNQYWGILAIGKLLQGANKSDIPKETLEKLKQYHKSLAKGTDREYELSRIIPS
ncbi:MAG TPA: YEATS-associated helix-containing protein [Pyrinomonadaceae bacterium]|jgi:hypothetical protein